MIGVDDRRSFLRMAVNAEIEMTLADSGEVHCAHCSDLSATGMQVESPVQCALGDALSIRLQSLDGMVRPLTASAKVVRCESMDDGRFQLGLELLELK